jgi:hypothetical protein
VNARTGYSSAERGLNNIGDHLNFCHLFWQTSSKCLMKMKCQSLSLIMIDLFELNLKATEKNDDKKLFLELTEKQEKEQYLTSSDDDSKIIILQNICSKYSLVS